MATKLTKQHVDSSSSVLDPVPNCTNDLRLLYPVTPVLGFAAAIESTELWSLSKSGVRAAQGRDYQST